MVILDLFMVTFVSVSAEETGREAGYALDHKAFVSLTIYVLIALILYLKNYTAYTVHPEIKTDSQPFNSTLSFLHSVQKNV